MLKMVEQTVLSVGPCKNAIQSKSDTVPGAICVVIEGNGEGVEEEYMVDGSEMPKDCVLSNDGTLCMDKQCNFHEYKVGLRQSMIALSKNL